MRKFIYILMLLLLPSVMFAQATKLPYFCSFEEEEDLSAWVLNSETQGAADQWIISNATHSEGKRSLYISDDAENPHFGKTSNTNIAYLRYKFPDADGQKNYDLSFDWKCIGATNAAMLYVMVCPERFFLNEVKGSEGYYIGNILSDKTPGILSNKVVQACSQLGPNKEKALLNVSQWNNISLSSDIRVSSRNSKEVFIIAFIWVNSNRDQEAQSIGACIDNIQIASATLPKPMNLNVEPICEDSTLKVTWESTANNFVVEYRTVGTNTWRRADGLTVGAQYFEKQGLSCEYSIQRVLEGSYDVRVKCALGNDTSAYSSFNNILMYCPYNHCINFLALDNPYLVCTYGYVEGHGPGGGGTPYDNIGYIYDPTDRKTSRHTVMTDLSETDPNTDNCLMCVPKGEMGSMRLGNWNTQFEAESMTYTFSVDSFNASILLIKYAIVLNKPNTSCGDPGMKVELFDENDNAITDLCGVPDFTYSSAVEAGNWNENKKGDVVWKDWTTVGINLMRFAGQNLKVRLTTRDCGGGGHFGYGYFCLNCASAYIETENCGNDVKITCRAPEGFNYLWTDENGTVVGHDRELLADAGYHTYTCRVAFIDDPSCYFEVSTISAPRFPVPEFKYQIKPEECRNLIYFTNKSHIMNKYAGYENHTSEICTDQEWTFTRFSDGKVYTTQQYGPRYEGVSPEGDTILVRLRVFTGENNACDSTLDSLIIVPSIVNTDSIEFLELCQGDPYKFNGTYYAAEKDTVLADTTANYAGCDSIYTLLLKVHPKTPEQFRVDSICSDSAIYIGDKMFDQSGSYRVFMVNKYGCDSIVTMDLTVNQLIAAGVTTDMPMITCADGENLMVDFRIWAGEYDSVRLVYDSIAHKAGFRDTVTDESGLTSLPIPYTVATKPGQYSAELEFHQFCCGVTSFTIPFEIKYRSSIVEQKWNDVLAVTSKKYNGGYEFVSYQWYKNDQPIIGATGSYLYEPLDTTAYYHVVLTRGDSVAVATCPITPTTHYDVSKFPTLAKSSQRLKVQLNEPAQIRIFTASGQLYSEQQFGAGPASVIAPATVGAYIVDIVMLNGEHTSQYLIVGN